MYDYVCVYTSLCMFVRDMILWSARDWDRGRQGENKNWYACIRLRILCCQLLESQVVRFVSYRNNWFSLPQFYYRTRRFPPISLPTLCFTVLSAFNYHCIFDVTVIAKQLASNIDRGISGSCQLLVFLFQFIYTRFMTYNVKYNIFFNVILTFYYFLNADQHL